MIWCVLICKSPSSFCRPGRSLINFFKSLTCPLYGVLRHGYDAYMCRTTLAKILETSAKSCVGNSSFETDTVRHLSLFWYPIESTLQENDCHISSSIQLRRSFSKCLKGFSLIHVRGLHKSLSFGYTVETLSNHEGHRIGLPSSFLQNVWPNYQVALTPRCQATQCRHLPARSCHSLWLQEVPTWFFLPFTSQVHSNTSRRIKHIYGSA